LCSCDQLVIDRERALLDDQLPLSFAAALPQRAGMLEGGDRAVLGEAALVAAHELARVQPGRCDLALADADLNATANQVGASE